MDNYHKTIVSAGILGLSVLGHTPYFHILFKMVAKVVGASHRERRWGAGEKLDGFDDKRLYMGRW